MTALAEKMQKAGVDTIGAQLTAVCVEALRREPNNLRAAWDYIGARFGWAFLSRLQKDLQNKSEPPKIKQEIAAMNEVPEVFRKQEPKPYVPRSTVISPERLERRRQLAKVVSKYKNSGDVAWSDVSWHELPGLKRDGKEAQALLAAGPSNVPNDGRTVGDVLGIKRTDEIIAEARKTK